MTGSSSRAAPKDRVKMEPMKVSSPNALDIAFPTAVQPVMCCREIVEDASFALYVGTEDQCLFKLCFRTNADLTDAYLGSVRITLGLGGQASQYYLLESAEGRIEDRLAVVDARNSIQIVTLPPIISLNPTTTMAWLGLA